MVENSNSPQVFDEKLKQLEIALCFLKRTLDVFRIVALNHVKIKKIAGVGQFFAHVRQATLESLVLGICRVFEGPSRKTSDPYSVPGVLRAAEPLPLQDPNALRDFLRTWASDDEAQVGDIADTTISEVREVYARFWTRHEREFLRMRAFRNRIIAHAEYIEEDVRPRSLPSYDFMERLLLFAVDLDAALLKAYLRVHAHRIRDDGLAASSTRCLLKKLGIEDVKVRFDEDE
jgi:hypothetical protein